MRQSRRFAKRGGRNSTPGKSTVSRLTIVIGNKAYSSWSLRGWLILSATGEAFDEVVIPLDRPETREALLAQSPAGRVPILKADGLTIWDSLAIGEYLAERFPQAVLWPAKADARAVARSVSAEMHSGFEALRRDMPMDLKRDRPGEGHTPEALADIGRITALWSDCRNRFGAAGPFLFGEFGIVDAMYAPVATRLATYCVTLDTTSQAYVRAVLDLKAMRQWTEAAKAEPWVLDQP